MNKKLICYFSATGTTRSVANKMAKVFNCDLFEIEPTKKYTDEDLDWTNDNSRSSVEAHDESLRPSIIKKIDNLDLYDTIFIGFPVWWYKEPNIIDTFIEENNLENKNVYVFVTSGSSTVEGSLESLREKYCNINFISGKRLDIYFDEVEILNWIK